MDLKEVIEKAIASGKMESLESLLEHVNQYGKAPMDEADLTMRVSGILQETGNTKVAINLKEMDIAVDETHDLLKAALQKEILNQVRRGEYEVVVASPPCRTFSRARWANSKGIVPFGRRHTQEASSK